MVDRDQKFVRGVKSAPHRTALEDGESEVKKVFGFTERAVRYVKPNLGPLNEHL